MTIMNPSHYIILFVLSIEISTPLCGANPEHNPEHALKLAIQTHKLSFLAGNIQNRSSQAEENEIIYPKLEISSPGGNCDPTGVNFNCGTLEYLGCTGKKQFFHESTVKVTWFEAWEYCRTYGMHLAAIESRYEHLFLETFLEKPQSVLVETYWTSGNRFSGPFTWMSNGKLITYVNWRNGEPNNRNGIENCVEIVTMSNLDNFRWNDRVCNTLAYALCQKDITL